MGGARFHSCRGRAPGTGPETTAQLTAKNTEPVFFLPADLALNREQSASQALAGSSVNRGRGDKQRLQMRASKSAGRDFSHWHLDYAVDLSLWRDPHNATAVITAVPEITFGIYCR